MPEFGPGHGWVRATVTGRWRFIEGLGEDIEGGAKPPGTPARDRRD